MSLTYQGLHGPELAAPTLAGLYSSSLGPGMCSLMAATCCKFTRVASSAQLLLTPQGKAKTHEFSDLNIEHSCEALPTSLSLQRLFNEPMRPKMRLPECEPPLASACILIIIKLIIIIIITVIISHLLEHRSHPGHRRNISAEA